MSRKQVSPAQLLHADAATVVAFKAPGVLVTPGGFGNQSVPELLADRLPLDQPLLPLHRLDQDASGLVLYARAPETEALLQEQFADGRLTFEFLALIGGHLERGRRIDLPLRYRKRVGRVRAGGQRGKPALTEVDVVEPIAGNTLVRCRPRTDYPDQLRAHLHAIGHPLTVDTAYGGAEEVRLSLYKPGYQPSRRRPERPLIARLTLHCARVAFEDPITREPRSFESDPPRDFQATVAQLRRCL